MKRPDNPIIERLEQIISELHRAEKDVADAKALLCEQARAISEMSGAEERIYLAIYAYWHMPEIVAADLAFAATGKEHASALHKIMGPVTVGIDCDGCHEPLPITSRTQMKEAQDRVRLNDARWAEGYRVLCADCELVLHHNRRLQYEARNAANLERRQQLMAMPYEEYLTTRDWLDSLQSYVDFARRERKEQTLLCEVCGSEDAMGAYHKRLDNLGHEGSDDLVFLGDRCLPIVTGNGLIAGQPGNLNLLRICQASPVD